MTADSTTRRLTALAALAMVLALGVVLWGGPDEPTVPAPPATAEKAPAVVPDEASAPVTGVQAPRSESGPVKVREYLEVVAASGGDAAEQYEVDSPEEVAMADRNRRSLLGRTIANLRSAAAAAEAEGNPARAKLMLRRIDTLSEQLDNLDEPAL